MKVYYFYIKEGDGIVPRLHSFTDSKKIADRFKHERNMKKFITKKIDMDKNQFYRIYSLYDKLKLRVVTLKTSINKQFSNAEIVMSDYEYFTIICKGEELLFRELEKYTNIESFAFNKEISSALNDILYFYSMKNRLYYDEPYLAGVQCYHNSLSSQEINDLEYRIDELALFIKFYGHTLK